ncbi:DUF5686 and carboxypeptidase regulatory-like domain-containing protein [Dyadobacter sp. CY345]|uniref:DUF5686 and carboxypeptidase regulatory-like domain-containing protein n=1 Tax=Dyadobacter sp. CY345 TaxID=2909335 RepID=UPI001F398523|nr:DUF5686 and carboxypeptidase regulatory-like domain-containing protein [Dyadobacter sp. CY345]MCF2442935.1 DUF5686 and carboxypeptidase regulatory-like domain-containing protein [Dyadobacter sp. CY345]
MRLILCSLFILFIISASMAGGIKGRISNKTGEALPYAGIVVKTSGEGTIANDEGLYEFALPAGTYEIIFQYLGFKTLTKSVVVGNEFQELNIVLEEQALNLNEVKVDNKREDPAYTIMRKAIAKARFHQLQVRAYTAKVYSRSTALPTKIPYLVERRLRKEGVQEGKAIINESVAEIQYRRPNNFKQHIISTRNSLDNSIPSPNEYILASLYSPEIAGTISPLSPKSFAYYKFEYEGYFEDRGQIINKIKVIPRAYGEGVFRGSLYIIDERWAIHSYDLETTNSGLDISAKQIFNPIQNVWLPVNQQFRIKGSYLGFAGEFKYLVSLTYQKMDVDPGLKEDIVVNDPKVDEEVSEKNRKKNLEKMIQEQKAFSTKNLRKFTKEYDKELKKERKNKGEDTRIVREDSIVVDTMANKRDTTYWENLRPIPLTNSEVQSYAMQDSIRVIKDAHKFNSRPDSTNFKIQHILVGNTYSFKKQNFLRIESPFLAFYYNTVEGYALNLAAEYQKRWGKSSYFTIRPYGRYTSGRDRFNGNLQANIGNKNSNFMITGGEMVNQINRDNPITPFGNTISTLIFERNRAKLYQSKFLKTEYSISNIFDVFSFNTSLEYEQRQELFDMENIKSLINWPERNFIPNRPINDELESTGFPNHDALVFQISADIRPWRRYLVRNGEKRYLRSKKPSFSVLYKSGLGFGGDVDYDFLQGGIRQSIDLGPRNTVSYSVKGGGFLSNKEMYFPDFRHFLGNESFFRLGDPLTQFRSLPYYEHSTQQWFVEGHALWSMQRFLITQLPVFRLRGLKETVQLHYLFSPTSRHYGELVYGVDHILRFFRIETVVQFDSYKINKVEFRLGTTFSLADLK